MIRGSEKLVEGRAFAWATSVVFAALIVSEVVSVITDKNGLFVDADKSVSSVPGGKLSASALKSFRPSAKPGIKQLTQAHLFGQSVSVQAEPIVDDAPDTKLQLKLRGIFAGGVDSSYAIILYKNKPQQYFSIGDSVHGLATLHSIYPDKVILQRKTRFETLRLPIEETVITVKRNNTAKLPSLSEFSSYVKLLPEYDEERDDDSLIGFIIIAVRGNGVSWLDQLGLKKGDIIVSANGTLLQTEDSIDVFDMMLKTQASVLVVVKRDDSLFNVTLK